MKIIENASLKSLNTFGIDAQCTKLIHYNTVDELKLIIASGQLNNSKVLHIGGGSNLLFMANFEGVILHSQIKHLKVVSQNTESIQVEVGAGMIWDDLVAYAVQNNWYGIENLSLIPGEVGASAIQNIGAYGVEVCECIKSVQAVHLKTGEIKHFSTEECHYGYRESIFKNELKGQYAIVSVVFELQLAESYTLNYQHLEEEVRKNGELNLQNVRHTIIAVRESKLPDPLVAGNAGSFFMNPVVPKATFEKLLEQYPLMPHYYVSPTYEKVPAGWLIDQCGWKGKAVGNAGVHDKQALVLVNKGGATGAEIVHLAQLIQQSVSEKFGIIITPEVNYIS
ncbi:MAG: UDP-N-acetylmuramate dehydrogenase [Paludibacter sp.]|nr:UDP-N-acetylmuramate dehydrogenase [Paludibacter sp.]